MNIVIVKWKGATSHRVIDGRLPLYTTANTAAYWVPDNQVDEFITMALAEPTVVSCNRYTHHSTHR